MATVEERIVNDPLRRSYRVLSEEEKAAMDRIKDAGLELMARIREDCPMGREQSLAITKTEEAVMWACKGLTG